MKWTRRGKAPKRRRTVVDLQRVKEVTQLLQSQAPNADHRVIHRAALLLLEAEALNVEGTRTQWPLPPNDGVVRSFIETVHALLDVLHSLTLAQNVTVPAELDNGWLLENYLAFGRLASAFLGTPVVDLMDDPNIVPQKKAKRR